MRLWRTIDRHAENLSARADAAARCPHGQRPSNAHSVRFLGYLPIHDLSTRRWCSVLNQLVARVGANRPTGAIAFDDVDVLLRTGGGVVIGNGLLRVHTVESARQADTFVRDAYPEFGSGVRCFAFDWAGRQFSIDLRSPDDSGSATISMFEPGTGEALQIPVGLGEFFHEEIVDYSDAALAEGLFAAWRASGGSTPTFTESVGYRIPLYLGGVDEVSNLELTDTAVYWALFGQLRVSTRGLPAGTRIDSVSTNEASGG